LSYYTRKVIELLFPEFTGIESMLDSAFQGIFSTRSFRSIYLYDNELVGTIPEELFQLSELEYLILHDNSLTGTLSSSIGQLTRLDILDLNTNRMVGSLPTELGRLSLDLLLLGSNTFSGTAPTELFRNFWLRGLSLNDNVLWGTIPSEIGLLNWPIYVGLSSNQLSGTLPPSFSNLKYLRILDISSNELTSTIPEKIYNELFQPYFFAYEFSAAIGGSNPCNSTEMSGRMHVFYDCDVLDLHNNHFTGPGPTRISSRLQHLDLSNNDLDGSLSPELWESGSSLTYFNISSTSITGFIPDDACHEGIHFDCSSSLCGCNCSCTDA
jgi:hypothetical protein